ADLAGVSPRSLERWVVEGRPSAVRGERLWLDGLRDKVTGWYSSRAAVARFLAELARDEEWAADLERWRREDLAARGIAEADLSVMVPDCPGCTECRVHSHHRERIRCGRLRGWR